MSINISSSESLRADVDFSKYQGLRRTNLINAIRRTLGLPIIRLYGWSGWERAEEAIALRALKGPDGIYKAIALRKRG